MSSERKAFNYGFDKGFCKSLDKIEKLKEAIDEYDGIALNDSFKIYRLEKANASARAIMQRFVDKVDSGLARSTETYGEMKEWLDE